MNNHPPKLETETPTATLDIDRLVEEHYEALYRFAFALSGNSDDAADLTQETYRVLLLKGGQIRDPRKTKTWLFTTLYRRFLAQRRRVSRHPEVSLEALAGDLPALAVDEVERLDGSAVRSALLNLPETYRVPLVMFYLQQLSYREIAAVLGIPIGTVMSRLSRGKQLLRRQLQVSLCPTAGQPSDHAAAAVSVRRPEPNPGALSPFAITGCGCIAAC